MAYQIASRKLGPRTLVPYQKTYVWMRKPVHSDLEQSVVQMGRNQILSVHTAYRSWHPDLPSKKISLTVTTHSAVDQPMLGPEVLRQHNSGPNAQL
jgi:hypothetical protein